MTMCFWKGKSMLFELVNASELEQTIRKKNAVLVDLRELELYRSGHWPGAVHIPYEQIEKKQVKLPQNRFLIFYCEHGGSSMQLARMLGKEGYKVATVVGGMESMKKVQENYFKK